MSGSGKLIAFSFTGALIVFSSIYALQYHLDNKRASSDCYWLMRHHYSNTPELRMMIYKAVQDKFLTHRECEDVLNYKVELENQKEQDLDDRKIEEILVDVN